MLTNPNLGGRFATRPLMITAVAFVLVLLLWNIPQLDFLLYPLRLFVTFIHETGHGLAAVITGGRFLDLTVFPNGSGLATTAGGSRLVVLPAGYLGAAAFGALVFYLAHRFDRYARTLSFMIGAFVGVVTLLYTDILSTGFLVGLAMAALLIFIGRRADTDINLLVLNILSMITSLNAVLDLLFLINNPGVMVGAARNDAAAFSEYVAPIVPPVIWALLWAGLALAMLWAAVYYSVIRPRRRAML